MSDVIEFQIIRWRGSAGNKGGRENEHQHRYSQMKTGHSVSEPDDMADQSLGRTSASVTPEP